jgi:hypothetical protein
LARTGRCGGVSLHALESRPFRPAGQAKRRAHLGRGSQLDGGSSSGQPRGEQSPGRVQIVCRSRPGANQSDGVRNNGAWRLAGSSPTRNSSCSLRIRARPWCAPVRPPAPRTGPAWFLSCCCTSAISLDNTWSLPSPRQQREASRGPGGGNEPPVAARTRRNPHRTCRRHDTQKRCSSKATFLCST